MIAIMKSSADREVVSGPAPGSAAALDPALPTIKKKTQAKLFKLENFTVSLILQLNKTYFKQLILLWESL